MHTVTKKILLVFLTLAVAGVLGTAVVLHLGIYNPSALQQHTAPVYRLFEYARVQSVLARSDFEAPDLDAVDWQGAGLNNYEAHCRQCHGAPGIAADSFSLGMKPAPTAIAEIARKRKPQEIYWVIERGLKLTGMPAWAYRLSEQEIWQLVGLVKNIPEMTVADYRDLVEQAAPVAEQEQESTVAAADNFKNLSDAERGRIALQQYNCTSCHIIPGISAARNHVGPPVGGITERSFIAGLLAYSDENFIQWVRFPSSVDPDTTMPDLGVTEEHARQMLAYLKSLQ